jgi:outer membrane protein assembly factor BamD
VKPAYNSLKSSGYVYTTKTRFQKLAILVLLACFTVACSGNEEDTYIARDVETLYNLGADELEKRRCGLAAALFDEVERQHPYSVWARRSQLMAAYSHYQSNEYDDAILAAQRFLSLHPGNTDAPYAYYLIALSYYEQIADVGRDQNITRQATQALQQVILRYPGTEFAQDAQIKFELTQDHLAGQDMDVGRFYQNQQQYIGAMSRFRNVVEKYQTTSHIPEALHRLVEIYTSLGLKTEAQTAAAVLGYNFPNSKWYRYSYALMNGQVMVLEGKESSFFGKLWPF